ncbi:MAG: RNA polymerase sigma factor, partial [Myxococcaceae bacterium]|nr:RNA polymerase sigma factor [Myxococcaceae bacterium]
MPSAPSRKPPLPAGAAQLSDEEVARRVCAGETALFEVLMRRYNARVYRAVRSCLRDEGAVEEVMQQAYLRAFTHLDQFSGAARLSTWLVRIAVNEALMRRRREVRLHVVADVEELSGGPDMEPVPSPEDRAARRELASLLERAVDSLSEGYRTTFVLREVEGLSTAETAEVLGVSEDVVKTRLHRAKGQVRDALYAAAG